MFSGSNLSVCLFNYTIISLSNKNLECFSIFERILEYFLLTSYNECKDYYETKNKIYEGKKNYFQLVLVLNYSLTEKKQVKS